MAVRRSSFSGKGGAGRGFEKAKPTTITAWSYSRWSEYEECPRKAKYKVIDKLPDPGGPAMERGSRIHGLAENWVKGTITGGIPKELATFTDHFTELKSHVDVRAEESLAFTNEWKPTGWFDHDTWCRVKVDVLAFPTAKRVETRIIDHKTGRIRKSHEKQIELYGLAGFKAFPTVKKVVAELWYLDEAEIIDVTFEAKEAPGLEKKWNNRVRAMLADKEFRPRTGNHCRWCPFSKEKGGPCEAG